MTSSTASHSPVQIIPNRIKTKREAHSLSIPNVPAALCGIRVRRQTAHSAMHAETRQYVSVSVKTPGLNRDQGRDDQPCDAEQRRAWALRGDELFRAGASGYRDMQRVERRQAEGAGFPIRQGDESRGNGNQPGLGKEPLIQ